LGGQLQDEEGKPFVNEQVLLTVLEYYLEGFDAGIFPDGSLLASTAEDVWPAYASAQVGVANVTSQLFLSQRGKLQATSYAAIPTRDGNVISISRGRVLAVTTRDPVQQVAALHLIAWMLEPDNTVAWSEAANHLPTRYAAFELLGANDPYWTFAQQQLEVAVPAPSFSGYDQVGRVFQQAVTDVLSGEAEPEDAAATAFDAIPR
jgi:ABC-type glycerol-3-phosphate transport system substrate-binding protein